MLKYSKLFRVIEKTKVNECSVLIKIFVILTENFVNLGCKAVTTLPIHEVQVQGYSDTNSKILKKDLITFQISGYRNLNLKKQIRCIMRVCSRCKW